jgi:hypothetical protein
MTTPHPRAKSFSGAPLRRQSDVQFSGTSTKIGHSFAKGSAAAKGIDSMRLLRD